MGILFGDYIRSRREALRKKDPGYSIRQVAKRLGVHHSYLSKVERGEPATLSEKVIQGLARELGENPTLLMAMNGGLTEDLRRAICKHPETFSRLSDALLDPAGPECRGTALSFMHGLRNMHVVLLDQDMNVIWARHQGSRGAMVGHKCHKALFGTDEPCPGCPTLLSMKTGIRRSGDAVVRPGEQWLVDSTPVGGGWNGGARFVNVAMDMTGGLDGFRAAQQAERMMLHDLKSPLAGIYNLSRMLAEDANLTPDQADGLRTMAQTAEDLIGQVVAVLDVRLIESGQREVVPVRADVAKVVRNLGCKFRSFNQSSGVNLDLRLNGDALAEDGEVWALCDPNLFSRILDNLLANAFEAARPDDTVLLEVSAGGGQVAIAIWNPQPIPDSIRKNVFERSVASSKQNGCGLGAYSARIMTECMGGTIRYGSSDEQGTTVTVTLPV